jgi:hypothetical protein
MDSQYDNGQAEASVRVAGGLVVFSPHTLVLGLLPQALFEAV